MSFGDYLRAVREQQCLTLDEIAAHTKIKRHLLADLEDDDLARWPKYLVYRHGYLRSIADALDLDRDDLLDRFDDAFPEYSPVAFDGGRPANWQLRRATAALVAARVAAGIVLGLFAGLAMGGVSRWMARDTPVGRPQLNVGPSGRDVALEAAPTVANREALPASSSDAVRAVNESGPEIEGEMRVLSNPPDAIVTVNGIRRGRTPARIRYLPLGAYTVRVIQDGYAAMESRVMLTSDEPVRRVRLALRER